MSSPKRSVLDVTILGVAIILVAFSLKVTFDMLCDLPEVRLTNIIVIMFVLYFDVQILKVGIAFRIADYTRKRHVDDDKRKKE